MPKENNDVRISAYLTTDQALDIKKLANANNQTVSEWTRQVLLEKLEESNANSIH